MTYVLYGGNPSPYSRKLRAILRYRRLPHVWKAGTPETLPEIAQVKPKLIPVLETLKWDGLTGEEQVRSFDHQVEKNYFLLRGKAKSKMRDTTARH